MIRGLNKKVISAAWTDIAATLLIKGYVTGKNIGQKKVLNSVSKWKAIFKKTCRIKTFI